MTAVAKERYYSLKHRPPNPIEFIANYLLQNNPEKAQAKQSWRELKLIILIIIIII